jgi:hypothetical protein
MALSTIVLDSATPNALCAATGGAVLNGMVPMYLLMAFFHLTPWLKLMSRRRSAVALFGKLDRSVDIQQWSRSHEAQRFENCRDRWKPWARIGTG